MMPGGLDGRRIALAVCGGIAAFKAVDVLRLSTEAGAEVRILMTPEATRFIAPLTFEALSGHPVVSDWLTPGAGQEAHIAIAEWAEVIAIVPATANMLARLALGLADDIVSGTVLASRLPLVIAPAMSDVMLSQAPTAAHLATLRAKGAHVIGPVEGRLASGKLAQGRMASPERIAGVIEAVATGRRTLGACRVVVSGGGTREPIDPVRFIGNYSSGKMGRALAAVADARGAAVTLVTTAPSGLEGVREVPVGTAAEMLEALRGAAVDAHILLMAAAVADYRPAETASAKIKRSSGPLDVHLTPNVDVLHELPRRPGLFRVGFAAETSNLEAAAAEKLRAKGLDLIVANQVGVDGQGLGSDFNAVTILSPSGVVARLSRRPKWEIAQGIWDAIDAARTARS
jgi:phosphopantothenoylcysteine decarboxylase/phosphopantothenate--cysteine ligase